MTVDHITVSHQRGWVPRVAERCRAPRVGNVCGREGALILQIRLFSKLTPALLLAVVHLFVAAQYAVVVVVANDVAEDVVHKWLRPPFPSTEIKRKKKKKANARKES
jgi:hypothetical protein